MQLLCTPGYATRTICNENFSPLPHDKYASKYQIIRDPTSSTYKILYGNFVSHHTIASTYYSSHHTIDTIPSHHTIHNVQSTPYRNISTSYHPRHTAHTIPSTTYLPYMPPTLNNSQYITMSLSIHTTSYTIPPVVYQKIYESEGSNKHLLTGY